MLSNRFLSLVFCVHAFASVSVAEEDKRYEVPGHENETQLLNELQELHLDRAFSNCTLWDSWLPQATLWTGHKPRERYRRSFLNRKIDQEGYIEINQHRGMAHSDGWPFPAWQQSTGKGWHFSTRHDGWAQHHFKIKPLRNVDGWEITGADVQGFDDQDGLRLKLTEDVVTLTTPTFECGTIVAPFVRLEWSSSGLPQNAQGEISWLFQGESAWQADRKANVLLPKSGSMQFTNVPLYKQSGYGGLLSRYRVTVRGAKGAELNLKSLITAIDTRHPITGSLYCQGCCDYFAWTKDTEFLSENIDKMRAALQYSIAEFDVAKQKHVVVNWVGHDGRSGLFLNENGKPSQKIGLGVGNNYWDLLPFGGHDAIATMYQYVAMRKMVELEEAIQQHPAWNIQPPVLGQTAGELKSLASEIKADFQQRFWNPKTERFVGWIDLTGESYDYGFTFVNLEAIHYGLANQEQAQSILDWIDGERIVEGDTSQGADIYHWRFGPRSTTKRNIETYCYVWSGPQVIPWGNQVQDGGAVLGFSYFDLMARLKTRGPDYTWNRLQTILTWFEEVQTEGGYRKYYSVLGRGTLQGGGPPGGLGMDKEFMESILLPQVMLYGFMGFQHRPDGFEVRPQLPTDWPSLTIRGVHIGDRIIDITAINQGEVTIVDQK